VDGYDFTGTNEPHKRFLRSIATLTPRLGSVTDGNATISPFWIACGIDGIWNCFTMVPMSGATDRIWNGCTGVHWDNRLFREWRCTGKAMSNARQSPSRTGRVSKQVAAVK
jgi:hypothetical protein